MRMGNGFVARKKYDIGDLIEKEQKKSEDGGSETNKLKAAVGAAKKNSKGSGEGKEVLRGVKQYVIKAVDIAVFGRGVSDFVHKHV